MTRRTPKQTLFVETVPIRLICDSLSLLVEQDSAHWLGRAGQVGVGHGMAALVAEVRDESKRRVREVEVQAKSDSLAGPASRQHLAVLHGVLRAEPDLTEDPKDNLKVNLRGSHTRRCV